MKTKLLVFGITLMATSLMQATIYKVTNLSNNIIQIALKKDTDIHASASEFNTIKPNETIKINIKNEYINMLEIKDNLNFVYWAPPISLLSQKNKHAQVNIFVRTSDTVGAPPICIVQHEKKSEYVSTFRMDIKSLRTLTNLGKLEAEEGAQ